MKTFLKTVASFLLLINGVGAIYGGWHLMNHPDGSSLQMPVYVLQYSPFTDYFIPGLILFVANGLFSFFVLIALLFKIPKHPWLVMIQGAILTGWIVVQCLMLQSIHTLHVIFGSIGAVLMICGWMINSHKVGQIKKHELVS